MKYTSILMSFLILTIASTVYGQPTRISDNGRYLVDKDGKPFFYMGDTAWELFHRLSREEADHYLEDRAEKGFYSNTGSGSFPGRGP